MLLHPVGAKLFRVYGWMDRRVDMMKLIVLFAVLRLHLHCNDISFYRHPQYNAVKNGGTVSGLAVYRQGFTLIKGHEGP
jgi:hypothetical protein